MLRPAVAAVIGCMALADCGGSGSTVPLDGPQVRTLASQATGLPGQTGGCFSAIDMSTISICGPTGVAVDPNGVVLATDVYLDESRPIPGPIDFNLVIKFVSSSQPVVVAGSNTNGFTNGTSSRASFNYPAGLAADASGNVFVADQYNNAVRMISPAGVVTTVAGTGAPGFTNGTVSVATFQTPVAVAVDPSGNLYVADLENYAIREITSAGVVTTLAGSGSPGSANGIGSSASFSYPSGVAADSAGNVYVADSDNHLIRQITSGGVVTTLAGSGQPGFKDGNGVSAEFNLPYGVAVDASGNVFVADGGNNAIRVIKPGGIVTTLAGSGVRGATDGTLSASTFNLPVAVAVSRSGRVYVADYGNNRIRTIITQ